MKKNHNFRYTTIVYCDIPTAVKISENIGVLNLKKHMLSKYNTLMTTSLEPYEDKIIRIGQMEKNPAIK
ncbi:hypothetical protein [Clostridium vincentii]|uniref:hypothetical protein n=1 Tax=Clostridium vincentii TaxID=52704 RepID=UPI000D032C44|nr:hypothetical protein [Clostridium vincentii]